ncbi:unnamed protein product [Clonostachys rosea f. rosea IK726]|uniref:Uncharacterized protein n=1 Tax=Clonostachys rosea f. rosea IK726 TaxID=1349383 RepID=A0ACA9TE93_BIOOC|nr:unnamed protein product [Clonostachys rosea f. rosea IK726]
MSFQNNNGAYPLGQIIQVNCSKPEQSNLELLVTRHAEAWTSSCGMVVEMINRLGREDQPSSLGKPEEAFLKLFDRRHVRDLRSNNCIGLWGQHRERALIEGISNGNIGRLLYKLHTEPGYYRKTESHRDYADDEAFLWNECIASFHRERNVYSILSKYQGDLVPLFLGDVTLDVRPFGAAQDLPKGLFQVRGLLLEHLGGFSMADVTSHAPQSSWQSIFDKAIHIVHVLDGEGILNRGLTPEQFIVVPQEGGEYRVCMTGLGRCQIREDDESDEEWARKKWFAAEEDRLAGALKDKFEANGEFVLEFEPSLKYSQVWEKDEQNENK